jgi:hypothetical protein
MRQWSELFHMILLATSQPCQLCLVISRHSRLHMILTLRHTQCCLGYISLYPGHMYEQFVSHHFLLWLCWHNAHLCYKGLWGQYWYPMQENRKINGNKMLLLKINGPTHGTLRCNKSGVQSFSLIIMQNENLTARWQWH